MQVALKSTARAKSLKNLLLKYLEGKVIEKIFPLICFFLELEKACFIYQ